MDKDDLSKIEIDLVKKRRRYSLNKRKLGRALALFCGFAAVVIISCYLLFANDQVRLAFFAASQPLQVSHQVSPEGFDGNAAALDGKVVVIDAGHGGFDSGAISVSGVHEAELNLNVAEYLQETLSLGGANVIMTRIDVNALGDTKKEDMAERRRIILQSGADIVVSIHMNAHIDPEISGPVVIFMESSVQGEILAKAIQESLNAGLDTAHPGSIRSDNLYVLRSGPQPSVLIECGYLTNPAEEARLTNKDYQRKVAKAVCDGIDGYFAAINAGEA
ncbi:MAG: N-acetylmuramoyl-L-alanine amidase family protein [Christensenellales bacterium]|jgi:N-acetylmuramoyl-L-alanine amidase